MIHRRFEKRTKPWYFTTSLILKTHDGKIPFTLHHRAITGYVRRYNPPTYDTYPLLEQASSTHDELFPLRHADG